MTESIHTHKEIFRNGHSTDLQHLDSWKNVSRAFRDFGHCDDGGIAEGFDEAISVLWVDQWQKLPEMLRYTNQNKDLKNFIYKRVWSETVPAERWQKILIKAQTECPKGGKEFCAEIIRAGKAAPNRRHAISATLRRCASAPLNGKENEKE